MTQKKLEAIHDLLGNLHGYAYFRPQEGPLKAKLTETVLAALSGDTAQELAQRPFEIEVNIGRQEAEEEPALGFSVDHPGVVYRSHLSLAALSQAELEDLERFLVAEKEEEASAPVDPSVAKTGKKREVEGDYLEQGGAAARLKVSQEWLKSVVPCTEYSYEEIEGKKYIRDYYWSRELVERLLKIKSAKTTPEDLQYVAKECCEGDLDWARDLIARLKSPNRPEPAVREQQKGQGKTATLKGGAAPKQAPGRPMPPRAAAPAQGGAGKPAGGSATAPAAQPAADDRPRGRRHKRFRGGGKDAARGSEPGAGQKHPQQ